MLERLAQVIYWTGWIISTPVAIIALAMMSAGGQEGWIVGGAIVAGAIAFLLLTRAIKYFLLRLSVRATASKAEFAQAPELLAKGSLWAGWIISIPVAIFAVAVISLGGGAGYLIGGSILYGAVLFLLLTRAVRYVLTAR